MTLILLLLLNDKQTTNWQKAKGHSITVKLAPQELASSIINEMALASLHLAYLITQLANYCSNICFTPVSSIFSPVITSKLA